MQTEPKIIRIGEKIRLLEVRSARPKTTCISLLLLTPMHQNPAETTVLASYLAHSCARCPTLSKLNARLESLYGALLSGEISRLGEAYCLRLSVDCLADALAYDGQAVSRDALELLLDLLLEPKMQDGRFDEAQLRTEVRLCAEDLESEQNDKRAWALMRMLEVMCADEPYGYPHEALLSGVRAVTAESMYRAWQELLKTAHITVQVTGDVALEPLEAVLRTRLGALTDRAPAELSTVFVERCDDVTELTEEQDVSQSKLVLGFRTGSVNRDDDFYARRVMADLFGGGPYSRLFMHVREKLSLCYYCSARLQRQKGLLVVQSGIERKNRDVAFREILRQLKVMQAGEFSDEELTASKKALCDAFTGVGDTPEGLDVYYAQFADGDITTPEALAAGLAAVTREDVVRAANALTLDTVYLLAGKDEEEAEHA